MNRRKFIQNSSILALPALFNGMPGLFGNHWLNRFSNPAQGEHILVLVQLFGGNDGLNTVIPLLQYDAYANARTRLAIDRKKVLPLSVADSSGLHPSLEGLQRLYLDGKLSILQSVGYPSPNFSHFRSSDIWMSASDSDKVIDTGWLGRYLNQLYPGYPNGYPQALFPDPPAIQIGNNSAFAFQGTSSPLSVNVINPEVQAMLGKGFADMDDNSKTADALAFVNMISAQSAAYGEVLRKAALSVKRQAAYPEGNALASDLKTVARLISSGLKTRVYLVSFDGFDTHAQQVNAHDSTTGRHAHLLKTVSDAILAFQQDLEFSGVHEKVIGMTFSEFGRRIKPNDSLGTDHGAAAPLFVFGSKVKGGIIGTDPVIPPHVSGDVNVPMQYDFRSVYASVLQNWLGVSAADVKTLLQKDLPLIPFL